MKTEKRDALFYISGNCSRKKAEKKDKVRLLKIIIGFMQAYIIKIINFAERIQDIH